MYARLWKDHVIMVFKSQQQNFDINVSSTEIQCQD